MEDLKPTQFILEHTNSLEAYCLKQLQLFLQFFRSDKTTNSLIYDCETGPNQSPQAMLYKRDNNAMPSSKHILLYYYYTYKLEANLSDGTMLGCCKHLCLSRPQQFLHSIADKRCPPIKLDFQICDNDFNIPV